MQIRKNTKAFKTILNIIEACKDRPDRSDLIRLFITKAGQTVHDRIYIEGIQSDANIFYELNFQAVLNNLQTAGYQLYMSDDIPGIYFLRGPATTWDETPFEFAEIILKKFAGLPELPVTRKKETPQKYALPTAREKLTSAAGGTKKTTKEKSPATPRRVEFDLKHDIEFTSIDRLVYTQAGISKRNVLKYYDQVAPYLLPWIKDRSLCVRAQSDTPTDQVPLTDQMWANDANVTVPKWIQQRANSQGMFLTCADKDHLLYYAERGCLEYAAALSRFKTPDTPDYIVLVIDSTDFDRTLDAMMATAGVLNGLHLPSFVKTDGRSGFHIYVPLDSQSDFETASSVGEYVCKLTQLKEPDLITVDREGENTYGKVLVDYRQNMRESSVIIPYSLVPGSLPAVAAPLHWQELRPGLRPEEFNLETIFKRLAKTGDPFELFFKKKVDGTALLQRLEENYAFLF